MRRRLVKEKPAGNVSVDRLPEVVPPTPAADERPISPGALSVGARLRLPTSLPSPLFSSAALASNADNKRVLDLRDKKKLRCIWLAPDEGDQQIVRPPPLDSMQYANLAASRFGQSSMTKIQRTDALAAQLEKTGRFMDAVHTYEQSTKMLLRCIQKRAEAHDMAADEIKWLRIDYEIRCVQLVALCLCGARKSEAIADNTPFLLLKKGEDLTSRDGLDYCKKAIQRAAVYQHLANYYKKQKKYQAALQAADKSVHINEKLPPRDRFPMAYFLKACLHGLLNDPSNAGLMYMQCLTLAESQQASRTTGGPSGVDPQALEVFYTLKAATLHNMAIEWANLHMPDQTREALASAMEIGVHRLPQSHPIVMRILETYKVMRQNFLFRRNSIEGNGGASDYLPTTAADSPRSSTGDPSASQQPLASTAPRGASPRPLNQLSPRSDRSGNFEPGPAELPPSRPPSRPADAARPSTGVSPRARTAKRPVTVAEGPVGLFGHALPPGATRTSLVVATPKETYSHALGARYNPHNSFIREEARVFVARTRAATKIQKCWRRALARRRLRMLQNNAATLIQSVLKMHIAKSRYLDILERVRCIQALWRGAFARSQRKERVFASVAIQAAWRAKSERGKFEREKAQIILLQSLYRGYAVRKEVAEHVDAAKKIQAHARRHLEDVNYKKTTAAAEVLNRAFRGMYARHIEYPIAVAAAKKREEEEREAEKREVELLETVADVLAAAVLGVEDTLIAEAQREAEQRGSEERETELVEAVTNLLASMALSVEATVTTETEEQAKSDAIDSAPAEIGQRSREHGVPSEETYLQGNDTNPDDSSDDKDVAVPTQQPTPARDEEDPPMCVEDDAKQEALLGDELEAPSAEVLRSQPSPSSISDTATSTAVAKTVRMDALLAKSDSNRLIIDAVMAGTISNYVEASVKAAIQDSSDPSAPYNIAVPQIQLSNNVQAPVSEPNPQVSKHITAEMKPEIVPTKQEPVEEAAVAVVEPAIEEVVSSAVDALVSDVASVSVVVESLVVESVAEVTVTAVTLLTVGPEAEAVVEGVMSEVVAALDAGLLSRGGEVPDAAVTESVETAVAAFIVAPEATVEATGVMEQVNSEPAVDMEISSAVAVMVSAVMDAIEIAASVDALLSDDAVASREVNVSEEYDASNEMSMASSSSASASSLDSSMSHFRLLMATDPGVSIDEDYVEGFTSECTGDLEDLDDALSEVFEELHGPGESPGSSPRYSSSHSSR